MFRHRWCRVNRNCGLGWHRCCGWGWQGCCGLGWHKCRQGNCRGGHFSTEDAQPHRLEAMRGQGWQGNGSLRPQLRACPCLCPCPWPLGLHRCCGWRRCCCGWRRCCRMPRNCGWRRCCNMPHRRSITQYPAGFRGSCRMPHNYWHKCLPITAAAPARGSLPLAATDAVTPTPPLTPPHHPLVGIAAAATLPPLRPKLPILVCAATAAASAAAVVVGACPETVRILHPPATAGCVVLRRHGSFCCFGFELQKHAQEA